MAELLRFCKVIESYFPSEHSKEVFQLQNMQSETSWSPYLRLASRIFFDVEPMYVLGTKYVGPAVFGPIADTECEKLGRSRLRIVIKLKPGLAPNEFFFKMTQATLVTLPTLQGQPTALVEASLTDCSGEYMILLPQPRSLWMRLRTLLLRLSAPREMLQELTQRDLDFRDSYAHLQEKAATLDRERAELENRVALRNRELSDANKNLQRRWEELARKENENRALNERIVQLEKLEALGRLSAGLSHKMNNVLHGIYLSLDMADRKTKPEDPAKESIRMAMRFAASGKSITDQVTLFGRQTRARGEPLELLPLLARVLENLRSELPPNIALSFTSQPPLFKPVILADPIYIERMIMNLCANAIDAMKKAGGRLQVKVRAIVDPVQGDFLALDVIDDGVGISDAIKGKIFDPFFSTRPMHEGSGLGLAVVFGIVQSLGGFIRALPNPEGAGARFEIQLPVEKSARVEPESEIASANERLLLVENEADLRDLLADTLRAFGYHVTTAASGPEALAILQNENFAVMITDLSMPEMSGIELAEKVLLTNSALPMILCSGRGAAGQEGDLKHLFRRFIDKPLDAYQLNAAIREVLKR